MFHNSLEPRKTRLNQAALRGDPKDVALTLLDPEAAWMINKTDAFGFTPMHQVASCRHNSTPGQLTDLAKITDLLLSSGANPNLQTKRDQSTAAHIAAQRDNPSVLLVLAIHSQIDLTLRDQYGYRPVDYIQSHTPKLHADILALTERQEACQAPGGRVTPPPGFEGCRPDPNKNGPFATLEHARKRGTQRLFQQGAMTFTPRLTQAYNEREAQPRQPF